MPPRGSDRNVGNSSFKGPTRVTGGGRGGSAPVESFPGPCHLCEDKRVCADRIHHLKIFHNWTLFDATAFVKEQNEQTKRKKNPPLESFIDFDAAPFITFEEVLETKLKKLIKD